MSSDDVAFSRALLAQIMPEVLTNTTLKQRKQVWVHCLERGKLFEFHGPDKFYWHGRANDMYEARYKGWDAWLNSMKREQT